MDELQAILDQIRNAKMPQWRQDYANQIAYNLQVHTKGLMFDKVTGLYPHEHPDSQKHCINSYESITKGSIWKAINNIIRVFNNSSYNIQISDKTQELIDQYQKKEGSFFSEFLEEWIKYAIATDPNGICVIYPPGYSEDLYRYVCFKDIVAEPTDEMMLFISEEESEKKYEFVDVEYTKEIFIDYDEDHFPDGAINVRHGTVRTFNRRLEVKYINKVYHAFTKNAFYRIYENNSVNQYEIETITFEKPLDSLPYFENGGTEVEYDVYESFVQPFIPFGNLALMSHRNHRAVDLMFSYPRMSEVQQPCDECQGTGRQKCATTVDPSGYIPCKRCKGSKYITVQSPYKVYKKTHDSFDAEGKVWSTPSVEFYSPDSAILNYSKDQWKAYLEQAEMAVFVQQKTDTGNVQAAKSKEIDREELYAWLANISKTLYANLRVLLQSLENYINPSPVQVSVEQPYSFAILTESEAFDALQSILASTAPVAIKANQIDNFVNKFISESSPVKRAISILKKIDLLFYYSSGELMDLKNNAVIDPAMLQRHTLFYPVLVQLYEKDKNIFDLEDDQIIKMILAEIETYNLLKTRTALAG